MLSYVLYIEWHFIYPTDIPEQYNLSDCGIFMCMYAQCLLAKRCSLNFNQDDIPTIVVELPLSKFDIVPFTCITNIEYHVIHIIIKFYNPCSFLIHNHDLTLL